MVVDPEYQIRGLLRAVLNRAGYEVQMARTAEEAIEACGASQCFDVVVTETLLDGMDGHELARRMTDRCPDSKVLFVSATSNPCDQYPHVGACPSIGNPFDPNEVVSLIADMLATRQENRD
jgi:DNA-binding NtrC family response regulator